MPPLEQIPFTTAPKVHNMAWQAVSPTAITYSGRYMVHVQQWGVYILNVDTGAFEWISPVGKFAALFQQPKLAIEGDCWQSGVQIGVNPNTPKWIVIQGAPACEVVYPLSYPFLGSHAGSIQVCRMDGAFTPHLSYEGEIRASKVGRVNGIPVIVGDTAYIKQLDGATWTAVDLSTLTIIAEDLTSAPDPEYQPGVDGYAYTIVPVVPNPPPVPFPGPSSFIAYRNDQGVPPPAPWPPVIHIRVSVAPAPVAVATVALTSGGHNYTSAPTVTVHGGCGSGAVVTAHLGTGPDSDKVVSLSLDHPGSGYLVTPQLVFSGGGGTGASGSVTMPLQSDTVEFSANGVGIGAVTAPPYDIDWQADQTGQIKIVATLARGSNLYSDFVIITINDEPLQITAVLS
jgi:hypothetical protein